MRVKPSVARKGVSVVSGIPYFKWEPGNRYKILFPILKDDEDVFMYQSPVHDTNIGGQYRQYRCINEKYQIHENGASQVIKVDENGNLMTDPTTGRVLNDGNCPICELDYLYRQHVGSIMDDWEKENPDATKDEKKKKWRELFDKNPVKGVINTDKDGNRNIVTTTIALGIVFTLDDKGKYVLDKEGYPVFEVNQFNFTSARFRKIMSAIDLQSEYAPESIKAITDESGLAWRELILDFPEGDKTTSGKEMTATVVPNGFSAIEKTEGFVEKVQDNLPSEEELSKSFGNLNSVKVHSIPELEKALQGRLKQYRDLMSDEELADLDESLAEDEKYLSSDEAEELLDAEMENTFQDKSEAGDDAFLA